MLAVAACWAVATPAHAQLFSPGALAQPHEAIDNIASCTNCHEQGSQLSDRRCLACHKEIDSRVQEASGYHARVANRRCADCHREHRGRDAKLIEWEPEKFDHKLTGFPLLGSHLKQDCRNCHRPELITAPDARQLLATRPDTFLGLPETCSSCHFDEHRGQLGITCEKCHTPGTFKPARGFDHDEDALFALKGQHEKVDCVKCHVRVPDPDPHADARIAPRHRDFAQYTNVLHQSCASCHEDPHKGGFGTECSSCHQESGWRVIVKKSAANFAFHDSTDFPLRGQHRSLACKNCHGPFGKEPARFKGLPHDTCSECHVNAHAGQLAPKKAQACSTCHTETGFTPVTFGVPAHEKTAFPLQGAHRAVACAACHENDANPARALPARERAEAKRKGRPVRLSAVQLQIPGDTAACSRCHADPHKGALQVDGKKADCVACHVETTFGSGRFNHDATGFPLAGRHTAISCAGCHPRKDISSVRYASAPRACSACHLDVHGGQFALPAAKQRTCGDCHDTNAFVPSTFQHNDPAQSSFPLEDAHAEAGCVACHLDVEVAGRTVRRYRPTEATCAQCHADPHSGRYERFLP